MEVKPRHPRLAARIRIAGQKPPHPVRSKTNRQTKCSPPIWPRSVGVWPTATGKLAIEDSGYHDRTKTTLLPERESPQERESRRHAVSSTPPDRSEAEQDTGPVEDAPAPVRPGRKAEPEKVEAKNV